MRARYGSPVMSLNVSYVVNLPCACYEQYCKGGFSKIEPNPKGSITFDPHVGLVILTVNQI